MKSSIRLGVLVALCSAPASAQQTPPPDPAFLQKAIGALRQQRDAANDIAASQQARADLLTEEITKLKAEIEALKKAPTGQ